LRFGRNGYTVSGGLEYLFTRNWSGKIEYQYYDFGTTTFLTSTTAIEARSAITNTPSRWA
jgi:outer membrane immunogenic protein